MLLPTTQNRLEIALPSYAEVKGNTHVFTRWTIDRHA